MRGPPENGTHELRATHRRALVKPGMARLHAYARARAPMASSRHALLRDRVGIAQPLNQQVNPPRCRRALADPSEADPLFTVCAVVGGCESRAQRRSQPPRRGRGRCSQPRPKRCERRLARIDASWLCGCDIPARLRPLVQLYGDDALRLAARWGRTDTITELVRLRADPNAKNKARPASRHRSAAAWRSCASLTAWTRQVGMTALLLAAREGRTATAAELVRLRADVNTKDRVRSGWACG
jgi:hypothetical protein